MYTGSRLKLLRRLLHYTAFIFSTISPSSSPSHRYRLLHCSAIVFSTAAGQPGLFSTTAVVFSTTTVFSTADVVSTAAAIFSRADVVSTIFVDALPWPLDQRQEHKKRLFVLAIVELKKKVLRYPLATQSQLNLVFLAQALRFTEAIRARIEKAMDDCLTFDQQLSELPLARTRYEFEFYF
nr:hypothetical protein AQUCO_01700140v1 [Ipomoea batatas]